MRFAWLLCALPLCGCALWQEAPKPDSPAAEHFSGASALTSEHWPDAGWWRHFGSDELDAYMAQAQAGNFDIRAASARVRQADAQLRIAGASLFPQIEASGNAVRDRTPGGRVSSSGFSSRPRITDSFGANLDAQYEIDFWGKNFANREAAAQLADASRFDEQTVRLTIGASVANTYFDILATQERLALAQQTISAAEEVLEVFRKRFEVGVASELDVTQQETLAAQQRTVLPSLRQRLKQDYDALAILTAQLPEHTTSAAQKLDALAIPDIGAGVPSELLARRPDIAQAEAVLASNHADIIAARAALLPSVQLSPGVGYASDAWTRLIRPDSVLWSLAASITQPVFEGGRLLGQLDLAKARRQEQLAVYGKTVVSAFADVEDALAAVTETAQAEAEQQAAARAAARAYELTKMQLGGGTVDITTLLNTQRNLFTAQDSLAQARLARLNAAVSLYRALGGGWERPAQP